MKKALMVLGGIVVLALIGAGVAGWMIFGQSTSPEDGATYGPVTTVVDGYVACYLVDVGSGKFALVDTCQDASGAAIKAALEAKGATADDVTTVFLTHGHPDHVGGARAFDRAQVFAHPDEVELIEGKASYEGQLTQYSSAGKTAEVTGRMTHEQKIGVGTKLFESFHVPGHTPGSTILLVDGVLFLGDVGNAVSPDEMAPPPEVFSDDPAKAAASLATIPKLIEGRNVTHVLPAHSGPLKPEALQRYADEQGAK